MEMWRGGFSRNVSAFRIRSVKSDTSVCGRGRLFMVPAAGYTYVVFLQLTMHSSQTLSNCFLGRHSYPTSPNCSATQYLTCIRSNYTVTGLPFLDRVILLMLSLVVRCLLVERTKGR